MIDCFLEERAYHRERGVAVVSLVPEWDVVLLIFCRIFKR